MTRNLFLQLALGTFCVLGIGTNSPSSAANKKNLPSDASDTKFEVITNYGTFIIELDPKKAPVSSANFRQYANDKFYDGLVFHRVIPNFVIQGGGHLPDLTEKKGRSPIVHESFNGLKNLRGSLSMARMQQPDSATSQFFINLRDNPTLDGVEQNQRFGYAVFAQVVSGMEVIEKIATVKTGAKGTYNDVPLEPVTIKSIRPMAK